MLIILPPSAQPCGTCKGVPPWAPLLASARSWCGQGAPTEGRPYKSHSRQRQHALERHLRPSLRLGIHLNAIHNTSFKEVVEHPGEVSRMNPVHSRAGTDYWIEAEDRLIAMLRGKPVHHAEFGADCPLRTGLRIRDARQYELSRTGEISRLNNWKLAFGMDDHIDPRVVTACFLDLRYCKSFVNRTVPFPKNDPGGPQSFSGVSAERFVGIPHEHLIECNAHLVSGVASEMLIGKEQHALASLERPTQDPLGVRRRAHNSTVLATKGLERGSRI